MKGLQIATFMIAVSVFGVAQAASVAVQFDFLAGKAFYSSSGGKISFDKGEFIWDENLTDTAAALMGTYKRGTDAVLLSDADKSVAVQIEPSTGKLTIDHVIYSWGGGATLITDVGDSADLNEQFGYLGGKAFLLGSNGTFMFDNGHFRFFTAVDDFAGQYRIQEGAIRLIPDDSSKGIITLQVDMAAHWVKDLASGFVYRWPNAPSLPVIAGIPDVRIVPFEEQFEYLKGKSFEDNSAIVYQFSSNISDGRGTVHVSYGALEADGSYFIENGQIFIQCPDIVPSLQEPTPLVVYPITSSFVINPDDSQRGRHALASSTYSSSDIDLALARIKYLSNKIFRGESGFVAFDGNFSSFDAVGKVEVLDYTNTITPTVSGMVVTGSGNIFTEHRDDGNLSLVSILSHGQYIQSSLFVDPVNHTLIVNGKGYVWQGESTSIYNEQVRKPAVDWLANKTFTSPIGSKLTFNADSNAYTFVSWMEESESGQVSLGLASVDMWRSLQGLGFSSETTSAMPLEIDTHRGLVIYEGETFYH